VGLLGHKIILGGREVGTFFWAKGSGTYSIADNWNAYAPDTITQNGTHVDCGTADRAPDAGDDVSITP
jgi:hypothetical protein